MWVFHKISWVLFNEFDCMDDLKYGRLKSLYTLPCFWHNDENQFVFVRWLTWLGHFWAPVIHSFAKLWAVHAKITASELFRSYFYISAQEVVLHVSVPLIQYSYHVCRELLNFMACSRVAFYYEIQIVIHTK